jgi:hypothetical protein
VIKEICWQKIGDLPFKANIHLKISDIPPAEFFDNLPPPKKPFTTQITAQTMTELASHKTATD